MRPVRLEVEGFTAFRERTVVDFGDVELFALVGPTGAGKSSVIDALTFALYGSVPRLDDRRAVAPVISQNLTEARVRLDFTVDGVEHTAVRVVRLARSGATTKEARLQRGDEVLAGDAKQMTSAVEALIGLGFEHFTKCVSLPQGEFAQFLHAEPRKRQDLLVRLLDLGLYEQVASAARQRAALARHRAEVVTGQLERLGSATPDARAAAGDRVRELAALAERLGSERERLDRLAERAADEQSRSDELAGQVALIDEVHAPDGVAELAASVAAADEARQRCARTDDAATEAVVAAEAALAGLPPRAALEAVVGAHQRRSELRGSLQRGEAAEEQARAEAEALAAAEAAAHAERQARADELERVRVELRAQALVPELVVGSACPVCRQHVHELPPAHAAPDLRRAERRLVEADDAAAQATRAAGEAATHLARVDEKLVRVRADLAALDEQLAGAADPDEIDDQLAAVASAETELDKARQAARDARDARRQAERRHDELRERERDARRAFDSARDAVAVLQPPVPERHDLAADWAGLAAWAGERRPELVERARQHRAAAEAARADGTGLIGDLTAICRAADVDVTAGAWPGEAVAAARARAEAVVARIESDLIEAERLRTEHRRATEQQQVADALAGHLAANRFEKWLLDEAVEQLVQGASQVLGELTAGAYALAVDPRNGGFLVVDHTNASQTRPARTLSGGETFLASLALALALADQLAAFGVAGPARLEALFLDEGFGTLDPETLDVVAAALDELGARGRMVGVVTHVRDLADRLPVRFEVRKVGGSATVERVES